MKPKTEGKHTPIPWKWHIDDLGNPEIYNDRRIIASTVPQYKGLHDEANAAFICRAVNAHEGLVEACKKLVTYLNDSPHVMLAIREIEQAEAALKLAEGK